MAVLDSVAIEVQATIAGVLILLIITLLEIMDLQRARRQHRQELQAIASSAVPPQKKRLISPFSLVLQFIFGFSAFALFVFWMMYLIISGMPVLAGAAGVSAFIAVLMPFIVWSVSRKANGDTAEAIKNAEQRRQEPVRQRKSPETPIVQPAPAQAVKEPESIAAESVVKKPAQTVKPQPEPQPQQATEGEVKPAPYPKPDPTHVFPQDSMLRRHFIARLAAAAKPYEPSCPTDSMLRRHYDAMSAKQTTVSSARPVVTPAPGTAAQPSRKCTHSVKLPEDSMLRRHFLTALQLKLESCLSLPKRPTDSMLRRHFDAMKENLVAAELNKYREG